MITCRDVTAVEGGRALETARNKSEEILATIADGFCALDKNWCFDFLNVHAEVMLGKKASDVLGLSYFQVFPHAKDTQLHDNLARVMAEKHPLDFELMCPILKRPTSFSVHPTREGGIWVGFRDVSEQRAVEAALIAAKAEAERANSAKSTFLAAASHDLRQPVQSLVLLLAIAEREANAQPKTMKIISLMKRSLDGLNALLGSVLDLSRLDAGVENPVLETVDLGAKLLRLRDEYAPRAAAKGLKLRLAPRRIFVRSDARLLGRALRNLIENALRYTSRGGILIGFRRRGEYVRIDVYDTGIGIPADQQANIFEEFQQLHNPGRDLEKGLGLGLAIVARLARLLGAEIEVASRPGRGSRFSLLLPEVAGVSAPKRSESESAIQDPGGVVRHSLTAMLDHWGYDAMAVACGEDALELTAAGEFPFDILITDQRLGAGLTGTDTAKEINRRASRAVPALVLTGDTAKERIAEIDSSGYEMLHKPVSATELRRKIAALIRQEALGQRA
jgi:signal transduction histidine kinase/CheY-like chemotaxis protein